MNIFKTHYNSVINELEKSGGEITELFTKIQKYLWNNRNIYVKLQNGNEKENFINFLLNI